MNQPQRTDPGTSDQRRLREQVLAALDHLYCPVAPHDELAPFLEGVHGQPVAPADLDRLLADERRAFDAGAQRPIWLCVGICPDLRGDTDWAPWVRVVLPDSWLVREYWLVRQLWRVLPEDPPDPAQPAGRPAYPQGQTAARQGGRRCPALVPPQ
jgi:hypothetical protein